MLFSFASLRSEVSKAVLDVVGLGHFHVLRDGLVLHDPEASFPQPRLLLDLVDIVERFVGFDNVATRPKGSLQIRSVDEIELLCGKGFSRELCLFDPEVVQVGVDLALQNTSLVLICFTTEINLELTSVFRHKNCEFLTV